MNRLQYLRQEIQVTQARLTALTTELKGLGHKRLSLKQEKILKMLSWGNKYHEIAHRFNITPECLHTTLAIIRKKTGIRDTKSSHECSDWLKGRIHRSTYGEALPVTPDQQLFMEQLASGKSYEEIAKNMGVTIGTVQNCISRGCKRAGIVGAGAQRTQKIRNFLAIRETSPALDPMADSAFN